MSISKEVQKHYDHWQKNNKVKLDCRQDGHRDKNHLVFNEETEMYSVVCDVCGNNILLGAGGLDSMKTFFETNQQPNVK